MPETPSTLSTVSAFASPQPRGKTVTTATKANATAININKNDNLLRPVREHACVDTAFDPPWNCDRSCFSRWASAKAMRLRARNRAEPARSCAEVGTLRNTVSILSCLKVSSHATSSWFPPSERSSAALDEVEGDGGGCVHEQLIARRGAQIQPPHAPSRRCQGWH